MLDGALRTAELHQGIYVFTDTYLNSLALLATSYGQLPWVLRPYLPSCVVGMYQMEHKIRDCIEGAAEATLDATLDGLQHQHEFL